MSRKVASCTNQEPTFFHSSVHWAVVDDPGIDDPPEAGLPNEHLWMQESEKGHMMAGLRRTSCLAFTCHSCNRAHSPAKD